MFLAAVALSLALQDKPPIIDQNKVDAAIKRGSEWLIARVRQGLPADVGVSSGKGLNAVGLVCYTLLHAGVDSKDASVSRLVDMMLRAKPARTYQVSTNAMALASIDPAKHRETLALYGQFLVDQQCENGQWSYGEPYDVPMPQVPVATGEGSGIAKFTVKRSTKTRPSVGDNSNTQYAALGLRACARAGCDFQQSMLDKAIDWWQSSQQKDGGWGYDVGGKHDATWGTFGSMTAGGASSLVILQLLRGNDGKSNAAQRGMSWIGRNFTVNTNAKAPDDRRMWHYYYLYAMERLGDLYPTDRMGGWYWYAEGADYLIKNEKNGQWCGPDSIMGLEDTCFAILFLNRATRVATVVEAPKK